MKKILFLILFFSTAVQAQKKIHTEKEICYPVKEGKTDSLGGLKAYREYDSTGNITLEETYCEYDFDCNGTEKKFLKKAEYRYDTKGKVTETKFFDKGEKFPWSHSLYSYTYDNKGKCTAMSTIDSMTFDSNKTFSTEKKVEMYEYDEMGNMKMEMDRTIEKDYNIDFPLTFKYDKKSNIIEKKFSNNRQRFWYDEQGNCVRYKLYGRHICADDVVEIKKKYDKRGNLIEITSFTDRPRQWTDKYEYDEQNRMVRKYNKGEHGSFERNEEYFYNTNGDLTTENNYFGGKPDVVIKFFYEYY